GLPPQKKEESLPLIERLSTEGGFLERRLDLAGQRVAVIGERTEPGHEGRVRGIAVRVTALQGPGREGGRVHPELPARGIALLAPAPELSQRLPMHSQCRRQRPRRQRLNEHPSVVLVPVSQADESQHGGSSVRVIRPRRRILAEVAHAGTYHAEPGRSD